MTAPTAARLRELRQHHAGCPDMCPDAELLAALDHVAARLASVTDSGKPFDPLLGLFAMQNIAHDLIAYIGAPSARQPGQREPAGEGAG